MDLEFTGERLVTGERNDTMLEHLHRYALAAQYTANKTVLDIASGEGYGTNILAKTAKKIIGIDISEQAVNHAKEKYIANNLTYIVGSAFKIPLDDKSLDVIVSFETIEHHDKHEEMLSEFKRVLKEGGIVIISSPDKLQYSEIPQFNNPFHVKELYEHEFVDLVRNYFKEVIILYQRCVTASFISPLGTDKIVEFIGTYENIEPQSPLTNLYNIAIASDNPLPTYINGSFFQSGYLNDHEAILGEKYTNSTTWKIGRIILSPLTLIKKIFAPTNK